VDTALAGFIGVIAGALTTGGVQTWITSRQRRNDSLAAARLVYGSLGGAEKEIGLAEEFGQWGSAATRERLFAAHQTVWTEQRERLARVVDPGNFIIIDAAFDALRAIEETVAKARKEGASDEGISWMTDDPGHDRRVWLINEAIRVTEKAGRRMRDRPFAKRRAKRRLARYPPPRTKNV
jgi:hypothetical protein